MLLRKEELDNLERRGCKLKNDVPEHVSEIPKDWGCQVSTCYFSWFFKVWCLPKLNGVFITTRHTRDSQTRNTCSLEKTGIGFFQKQLGTASMGLFCLSYFFYYHQMEPENVKLLKDKMGLRYCCSPSAKVFGVTVEVKWAQSPAIIGIIYLEIN